MRSQSPGSPFSPFTLHPSSFLSLAPVARDFVTIIEKLFQSLLNQTRGKRAAQETKWWFVVYLIAQDGSGRIGLDNMPVPPTPEWPFDLHIFEPAWRIINRVTSNPPHLQRSKYFCLDYRFCAKVGNLRRLNHLSTLPRWHEQTQHVGLLMKLEDAFGGRSDNTLFDKSHYSQRTNQAHLSKERGQAHLPDLRGTVTGSVLPT